MNQVFVRLVTRYPYPLPFSPTFSDFIELITRSDTNNMWVWNVENPPLDCPIFELMESVWDCQEHALEAYNEIVDRLDATSMLTLSIMSIYKSFFKHHSKCFVTKELDDLAFALKYAMV